MKRRLTLYFTEFGRTSAETHAAQQGAALEAFLRDAAIYYARDIGAGRLASRVPPFGKRAGRAARDVGEGLELALDLDAATWSALEAEAKRQRTALERLLEHAALYYVAELDSGRVAARILEAADQDDE